MNREHHQRLAMQYEKQVAQCYSAGAKREAIRNCLANLRRSLGA